MWGFFNLCYCLVRLSLMISFWWGSVSASVAAFLTPVLLLLVFVVSVSDLVMLMGSHIFSWCWFLLVCPPCICVYVGCGLWGRALLSFLVGWWVISGFTGLCVLWGSLWFDADFSDWRGLRWWFLILRCCGLLCRDGDISQSCFMDELAVVPFCALTLEIESADYGYLGCSFW